MIPLNFLPSYAYKRWYKRLAAAIFDSLGTILYSPAFLFRRHIDPTTIERILVVRLDHIGDVTMTKPALVALHEEFPSSQIDLLIASESAPLFEDAREVREVIRFEHPWFSRSSTLRQQLANAQKIVSLLRERRYDLAIDFRGDLRNILLMAFAGIPERLGYGRTGGGFLLTKKGTYSTAKHQVHVNLDLLETFGVTDEFSLPAYTYSAEKKQKFWKTVGKSLEKKTPTRIVIHPGAGYPSKRWPASNFNTLIRKILEDRLGQVVLIGTASERKELSQIDVTHENFVDLRGQTVLEDLPILFDGCDLFVGNDSGPAHIAAAQGLPCVCVFSGTNDWKTWRPWTQKLYLVHHPVTCAPCESQICPLKHFDCMCKIGVQEVFMSVKQALSAARAGQKDFQISYVNDEV